MKRLRNKWPVVFACILLSCTAKKGDFQQLRDSSLVVQISRIAEGSAEDGLVSYKARLIPSIIPPAGKNRGLTEQFWYHMDSCFYLARGGQKRYAVAVQPVANGRSDSYEYLLQFEEVPIDPDRSWKLVYSDRYLSRKDYIFNISDQ